MRGAALLERPPAPLDRQLNAAEAWADLEHNVNGDQVADAIRAGVAPIAGAAQGLNPAVFMNNVPAPGTYAIDQQRFDLLTERNDVPQPSDAWPGFGGRIDHRIINVGVLTNIRLILNLSLVVSGTGAVTSLYPWPWNLLKKVSVNANGGSAMISCEGLDLRARHARLFRNPVDSVNTAPGMDSTATSAAANPYRPVGKVFPGVIANGTYTVTLVIDLPIVHDPRTLTGALFAQSDQNYLNWVIETAQQADLFSIAAGGAVAITGTVVSELTFFSIPSMDSGEHGRVVVLPNAVRWLHEFIATNNNFANTGDVKTALIRNNGQLVCLYLYVDNGGAAQIARATLGGLQWVYAGNQKPRDYTGAIAALMYESDRDYNGPIDPGYTILDFEKSNIARDVVYPRGLSELAVTINVPTSVTVNANAHVHTVLETLTSG